MLGGLAIYQTLDQQIGLSAAAQAGIAAYTVLISTVAVQKFKSFWAIFMMTAVMLIASKVMQYNQD